MRWKLTREVFYLASAIDVLVGDDLEDDGAIANEHHRKWNECGQDEVDPVPRSNEERDKLPASGYKGIMTWRERIEHSKSIARTPYVNSRSN